MTENSKKVISNGSYFIVNLYLLKKEIFLTLAFSFLPVLNSYN